MIVVPYLPVHLMMLHRSLYQKELHKAEPEKYAEELAHAGEAYTAMEDGKVLACCGGVPLGPYRYQLWAIMGQESKGKMYKITKAVKKFIDEKAEKVDRIETMVNANYELGKKWVELLGFDYESTQRKFAYGEDFNMYVRIR